MPSNIPATTIRIDPEVKREATAICFSQQLNLGFHD